MEGTIVGFGYRGSPTPREWGAEALGDPYFMVYWESDRMNARGFTHEPERLILLGQNVFQSS